MRIRKLFRKNNMQGNLTAIQCRKKITMKEKQQK